MKIDTEDTYITSSVEIEWKHSSLESKLRNSLGPRQSCIPLASENWLFRLSWWIALFLTSHYFGGK